jgi:WD40 repeat protein
MTCVASRSEHLSSIACIEFISPECAVSAGQDGFLLFWNTTTWSVVKRFRAHEMEISGLSCTSALVVSSALDSTVKVSCLCGRVCESEW